MSLYSGGFKGRRAGWGGRLPIDRMHFKAGKYCARKCTILHKNFTIFMGRGLYLLPDSTLPFRPLIQNFWIRHCLFLQRFGRNFKGNVVAWAVTHVRRITASYPSICSGIWYTKSLFFATRIRMVALGCRRYGRRTAATAEVLVF